MKAITQVTTTVMESAENFAIVKSLLSGMKVVINTQSSGAHEIKRYSGDATVEQGSILGLILFLLCINDFYRDVLRLLRNIYADDTRVYGCISPNLHGQLIFHLTEI